MTSVPTGVLSSARRPRRRCAVALLCCALSSCAVGPDYVTPPPPDTARFTKEPPASPGNGQTFVEEEVSARWWEAFGSPGLNALVEEALANSPTLEAAKAAIRAATYAAYVQEGALLPQIDAISLDSRTLGSLLTRGDPATQIPVNFHSKQLAISLTPDIWGGIRRSVESLEAQADRRRFEYDAARLTLIANLIQAAAQEASFRGQIAATKKIIDLETQYLLLIERQYAAGAASGTDISAQNAALAQIRQNLPFLEKQLAFQRNRLTALVGRNSSDEVGEIFDLAGLTLPKNMPLRLPAEVVAKRPDIRMAAADVHSASAQIGVAVAARLPNLTLTANVGTSALKYAELFTPGTGFYYQGAALAQPIFHGMALYHQQREAEAQLDAAKGRYRSTVVNALENVANSLRALQFDAKSVAAARAAEVASKRFYEQTRMQKGAGGASQLAVLIAQQSYQRALLTRVQSEAERISDAAGFFMAIGGG